MWHGLLKNTQEILSSLPLNWKIQKREEMFQWVRDAYTFGEVSGI